MLQNPTDQAFADLIANSFFKALQELPGQTYLGRDVVKHRIAAPADEEVLRAKFRTMIERSWNRKWGC